MTVDWTKTKLAEFHRRCATQWSAWVPIFDEESLAIGLVKCCLARWKKCVVVENLEGALAVLQAAVVPLDTVIVIEVETIEGEAAMTVVVMATVAMETEVMAEGQAIMVEAMIDLVTVATGQVRVGTIEVGQAEVLLRLRHESPLIYLNRGRRRTWIRTGRSVSTNGTVKNIRSSSPWTLTVTAC